MATAAVSDINEGRQMQLPRMGKYQVPRVRYAFGGSLIEALNSKEAREFYDKVKEGTTGTVTLSIDGHEREVTLGWICNAWGGKLVKNDGAESAVAQRRIIINDVRDGDDEGGDEE